MDAKVADGADAFESWTLAQSDGVDADELVGELGDTASIAMLQGESCMGACYPTLVAYTQQAVERAVNERAGVPLSRQVSL